MFDGIHFNPYDTEGIRHTKIKLQTTEATRMTNTFKDILFNFENSSYNNYNTIVICLLFSTEISLYDVKNQDELLETNSKAID